jgi:hypothetical protein
MIRAIGMMPRTAGQSPEKGAYHGLYEKTSYCSVWAQTWTKNCACETPHAQQAFTV